jgi:uncharacterized membrane protein
MFWVNLLAMGLIVAIGVELTMSFVNWAKRQRKMKIRAATLAKRSAIQLLRIAAAERRRLLPA